MAVDHIPTGCHTEPTENSRHGSRLSPVDLGGYLPEYHAISTWTSEHIPRENGRFSLLMGKTQKTIYFHLGLCPGLFVDSGRSPIGVTQENLTTIPFCRRCTHSCGFILSREFPTSVSTIHCCFIADISKDLLNFCLVSLGSFQNISDSTSAPGCELKIDMCWF
jgi:hypothetical protein